MNFKLTLSLIGICILLAAGYVLYDSLAVFHPERTAPKISAPHERAFYTISIDDMVSFEAFYQEESTKFIKNDMGVWQFSDEPYMTLDIDRWGGSKYILGGPWAERELSESGFKLNNLAEYGFDEPDIRVNIELTNDRMFKFVIGGDTPDGKFQYCHIEGYDDLYLIAKEWGDFISRFVTIPPYPKWALKMDSANIVGLRAYEYDNSKERNAVFALSKKDTEWSSVNPLNGEVGDSVTNIPYFYPFISRSPNIVVKDGKPLENDYTPWGITNESRVIEVLEEDTTYFDSSYVSTIKYHIGNRSKDGKYYYSRPQVSGTGIPQLNDPLIMLDSDWVDAIFSDFHFGLTEK